MSIESTYHQCASGNWDNVLATFDKNPSYGAEVCRFVNDDSQWTVLHHACNQGNITAVSRALGLGANHASQDRAGKTPLDIAQERGHAECADFLIENSMNSVWRPSPDPTLWPSSSKWDEAQLRTCTHPMSVGYGGGQVQIRTGSRYYVDNLNRVLIGWHGTYSPPCGMDGSPMVYTGR